MEPAGMAKPTRSDIRKRGSAVRVGRGANRKNLAARLRAMIADLDALTLHQSRAEERAIAACRTRGIGMDTRRGKRIAREFGVDRAEAEADRAATRFDRIAGKVLQQPAVGLADMALKTELLDLVDDRVLLLTLIDDITTLAGTTPPTPRLKEQ